MKKKLLAILPLLVIGILVGHFGTLGTEKFGEIAGSVEACGMCHQSIIDSKTFQNSNHRKNRFGIIAECGDCHARKGFYAETWDHVYSGVRNLILGTINWRMTDPKLQDEAGTKMAHEFRDWMADNGSSPCLRCHNDPNGYPMTGRPAVAREHEKAKRQGVSCIGCHYNLVHDAQPVRASFKQANEVKDDH